MGFSLIFEEALMSFSIAFGGLLIDTSMKPGYLDTLLGYVRDVDRGDRK